MDRAAIQRHLAMAEEHVALGRKHIARQVEIIEELERDGHAASVAGTLLDTFQDLQATHEADRDRIRQKLADLGGSRA